MLLGNEFNQYRTIYTDRLILRVLDEKYTENLLKFLKSGSEIFEKYEAKKAPIFYTPHFQSHILKTEYAASYSRTYLRYYIFEKNNTEQIIGTVSFGNILPDPYVCCNLGYKLSPAFWGKGYCTEAVYNALNAAFSYLNIHRINAFVQEDNISSVRVLEKCGFNYEGKCEKNLRINGKWTDHLLYAKINPFFKG